MATEVPGALAGAQPGQARESVITWYGELQSISTHLQRVHDRALRTPSAAPGRTSS